MMIMSLSRQNLCKNIGSHIDDLNISQSQSVIDQNFLSDVIADIYMTGSWCFITVRIHGGSNDVHVITV